MKLNSENGAWFDAVRLDSCATINLGQLTDADEDTGFVEWLDKSGEKKSVTLGAHVVKIVPRNPYKR